ncbi:hypothetical protein JVX98_10230 [Ensifer sp. PDNC004]|uniref:hypothetical protein n=1 Tax=Ensifer sp. PDNC004 TaxID=2811423 RepID=UPI0019633CEE|nr:hypothetical protein [Ensifer sp. PDNC004]QRY68623.1 hypothetical protein JVX98_10230 [Ensifer sp. PDNC004]
MSDAISVGAAKAMSATPFLQRREIILAMMTLGAGTFFDETDTTGTTYKTAADWLHVHDGEHVERLIRFDLDALHGEDVTESVADAWLNGFDQSPEQEHRLPAFVRTSQAWERWCADFGVRRAPFSQTAHGTLNHRQQFGTSLR